MLPTTRVTRHQRKPAYWLAHTHYAMTLAARGRFDEAVAQVRRVRRSSHCLLSCTITLPGCSLLARRYDEAIAQCRSAIDMDPNFPMAHLWMGISLEQQGLYDEAIASLDRAVTCMRGASIGVAAAAHAYAMSGRPEEARRRLSELQRSERPDATCNTTASHSCAQRSASWTRRSNGWNRPIETTPSGGPLGPESIPGWTSCGTTSDSRCCCVAWDSNRASLRPGPPGWRLKHGGRLCLTGWRPDESRSIPCRRPPRRELRAARAASCPGLRHRRDRDAGPGHRCEHDHLHDRRWRAAAPLAIRRAAIAS